MKHSWRGNISMLQCWRMLLLRKSHPSVYWIFQSGQPPAIKGDSQWKGVIKEKRKKRTLKYICKGGIFLINIYFFMTYFVHEAQKLKKKMGIMTYKFYPTDGNLQFLPETLQTVTHLFFSVSVCAWKKKVLTLEESEADGVICQACLLPATLLCCAL